MIQIVQKFKSLTAKDRLVLGILGGLFIISLGSCANRAFTPPRSDVIEQASKQGVGMLSVEEDREKFFAQDKLQQERLFAILRKRAENIEVDNTYRVGSGDEVEINVFDVPELNVTARVRESGFVNLALVGAVEVGGKTEYEIVEELRGRLSSFVRDPQVSVFISGYGSQRVAVLGAVDKPGTYSLKKGTNSILELISEAGGVNQRAGNFINFVPVEITGLSGGSDVESRARLALASSADTGVQNSGIEIYLDQVLGTSGGIPVEIPVRGGDMIIVPEAGKVMVEGEVQKVGSFDLGQRMTMLGALAAAGGITYGAKIDEIEIIRPNGVDERLHLVVDLTKVMRGDDRDVRLRNGDIVRVPSDSGRRLRQDTFEAIGKVINIGVGGTVNVVN